MSAKWERSKAWGRAHMHGGLTPLRWLLDALSSIPLAVAMLVVVAVWGFLGTIPLGWIFSDLPSDALLRHHRWFDLTEGEWYRLWPFQLALLMFVLNMIVATLRRIELCWVNLGVMSVHTGIVLLALGGWGYSIWKIEGLMLLPMAEGGAYSKREVSWFSDMTEPALLVRRDREADQVLPLEGLPRYAESETSKRMSAGDHAVTIDHYRSRVRVWDTYEPSDNSKNAMPFPVWELVVTDLRGDGTALPVRLLTCSIEGRLIRLGNETIGGLRIIAIKDNASWLQWSQHAGDRRGDWLMLGPDEALIVTPEHPPQRFMDIGQGDIIKIANRYEVRLSRFFPYLMPVQMVLSVGAETSDRHGGLDQSAIRVSYTEADADTRSIWLPFSIFGDDTTLIDERTSAAFTLLRHELAGASVRADAFEVEGRPPMLAPGGNRVIAGDVEDFIVDVTISDARGQSSQTIRLNQPATLCTLPASDRLVDRVAAFLGSTRYSLSVSGWDESGWSADQARYVVLTVGNTPGTDLVAIGGVLFALGTPWALFVKPWMMRRRNTSPPSTTAAERGGTA